MAEKRVVYLTFSTVDGKSASITISAPRAGITLQDAKTAANALVANKVILGPMMQCSLRLQRLVK
nr:DUF2922 domain-containing protein [Veillonella denticariosi]